MISEPIYPDSTTMSHTATYSPAYKYTDYAVVQYLFTNSSV